MVESRRLSYTAGMRLFGLTGGIASGKSTVAARFAARGLPVLDADSFAREVVVPGSEGLREIREAFGEGVLAADGSLDRKALAAIVFADEPSRRRLNAITHPKIAALTASRSALLLDKGEPLVCYEAALLVENGLADAFRPLVTVAAREDLRIARAVARDVTSAEAARARIAAQVSLSEAVRVADLVIQNDGDLVALHRAADTALHTICERVGVPIDRYPAPARAPPSR
jgi:dephospho-CoA kinase